MGSVDNLRISARNKDILTPKREVLYISAALMIRPDEIY